MTKKESYPVFSLICYTVMAVSAYSIYSTYTSKKPSSPEPVVVKAAPAKVNQSATPSKKITAEQIDTAISLKVAKDAMDQGAIAMKVGDWIVACTQYGIAAQAVLATKDQKTYVNLRDLEKSVCKKAGIDI